MLSYWRNIRSFGGDARRFLVASSLFGFTLYGGVFSVLLNIYMLRLGYGPEFIGLVNGASLLAQAFFGLPAGAAGQRWGLRRAMTAGLALSVWGGLLFLGAEWLPAAWQRGWLLASNVLSGLGMSLFIVNSSPFLMAVATVEMRDLAFSVQSALMPLAALAGSLLGGFAPSLLARTLGLSLDHPAPYRYALLVAPLLLAAAVPILRRSVDVDPSRGPVVAGGTGRPPYEVITVMAVVVALRLVGQSAASTFFNVYMDDVLGVSTATIGLWFGAGRLAGFVAALAMPFLGKRSGRVGLIVLCTLLSAVNLVPLALAPHPTVAGLVFVLNSTYAWIMVPAVLLLQQELVAPRWRTTMAGADTLATGLSYGLVAWAGGFAISAWGYPTLFLVGGAISAVGAMLFWAYFRTPRGELRVGQPAGTESDPQI